MAARAGLKTAAVAGFMLAYFRGKNPKHGAKAAAAEHFGVSRAAISYHCRQIRRQILRGIPAGQFNFESLSMSKHL